MNVVMIVPTGIGCEIGGHCGDGNAPARLLGAYCETLVLHPSVVNASDMNEMPPNALYVEGNHLDRFLQGKFFLQKVKPNKVLVVVNKADYQSINAVSAARATLGLEAEILELKVPLQLIARMENGIATGNVIHWKELVAQVKELEYDALGIATYRKSFEVPESLAKRNRLFLELGDLAETAEVTLNDKRLELAWLPPYRVEISGAVHSGTNQMEIRIANLWANRLNGDSLLPESDRFTHSNLDRIQTDPTSDSSYGRVPRGKTRPVYDKIPPLMKSGLFGPVRVIAPKD